MLQISGRHFKTCARALATGARCLIAAFFFFLAASGEAEAQQRRLALIIGNSDYNLDGAIRANAEPREGRQRDLPNAGNDARAVSQLLGRHYANPRPLIDADFAAMNTALTDFAMAVTQADRAADAAGQPRAVAVIYFAGHGIEFAGHNYLIPAGAVLPGEDAMRQAPYAVARQRLQGVAISVDDVLALFAARGSGVTLIVIDACRDDPWLRRPSVRGETTAQGLAEIRAVGSVIVVTSAEPGRTASDGAAEGLSPFARAFIAQGGRRDISFIDAFIAMVSDVLAETDQRQRPWLVGSPSERFCLVECSQGVRTEFLAAAHDGGAAAFEAFLSSNADVDTEYVYMAEQIASYLSENRDWGLSHRARLLREAEASAIRWRAIRRQERETYERIAAAQRRGEIVAPPPAPAQPTYRPPCPSVELNLYFSAGAEALSDDTRALLARALADYGSCAEFYEPEVAVISYLSGGEQGGDGSAIARVFARSRTAIAALRGLGVAAPIERFRIISGAYPARVVAIRVRFISYWRDDEP